MKRLFHVRPTLQLIAFGLIKDVEKDEVGEPLQILQPLGVLGEDLDRSPALRPEDALDRPAPPLLERAVDDTYRPVLDLARLGDPTARPPP